VVLRLQVVSNPVEPGVSLEEREKDHLRLIEGYIRSRRLRNLSETTNERVRRVLDAFFLSVAKHAWEVSEEDVAVWHDGLIQAGLHVSTRRAYVGFIRTFYDYVRVHPTVPLAEDELKQGAKPVPLQVKYGRELVQPVSFWVSAAHAANDASTERYLPTREELRAFFAWLRFQTGTARKPLPLARDYALYRFLYHTGLRANELVHLTLRDVRTETLVIHVRMGKGTRGSGPRSRWVPMMYGIDGTCQGF
jgi:integrase/recombinase XerD